jgi:hypothetical protein
MSNARKADEFYKGAGKAGPLKGLEHMAAIGWVITPPDVGSGKSNTQVLYGKLLEAYTEQEKVWLKTPNNEIPQPERHPAMSFKEFHKSAIAYVCELEFGGAKDWFLPSQEELDLMYENLYKQGKGDFKLPNHSNCFYWSSTLSFIESDGGFPRSLNASHMKGFKDGKNGLSISFGNEWFVRPIRQF